MCGIHSWELKESVSDVMGHENPHTRSSLEVYMQLLVSPFLYAHICTQVGGRMF